MEFFEQQVGARFNLNQIKDMDKIVKKKKDKYMSRSHFVRSAVIKQIRDER